MREPAAASVPKPDPRANFLNDMIERDRARLKQALAGLIEEASSELRWVERQERANKLSRLVALATEAIEMETRIRIRTEAVSIFSTQLPDDSGKATATP
jgi:hypothetical protein